MFDITLFSFAITCLIIAFFTKEINKEYALLVSVLCGIICVKYGFNIIEKNSLFIKNLTEGTSLSEYSDIILKTFGICAVVQITSDTCKDLGEPSLASKIETIGRLELFALTLPLIKTILDFSKEILNR